jgi:nonsense-mediated mRNA decay protein 3
MSGVTRKYRIKNEYVIGSFSVASILDKIRENRLRWFGHVMRRKEKKAVRLVMKMNAEGNIDRERPKKIWLDMIENDMRVVGVCVGDV